MIACRLERLTGHGAAHVRALGRGEESAVCEIEDALLPGVLGFDGWVDVLKVVLDGELDGVADPAALDLDGGRAVGEEGGALGTVLE